MYLGHKLARHHKEAFWGNFHAPVKTGGIEIGKVKDHRFKPAALNL
jgi:hypothetical protein